ncbi:acyltransferase [uncultured Kushneria sp.]|uniref:acyltransferase family protein n=1 Tax=uncultured Kushneria sp. TaxID=905033 RepID=UPI002613E0EE|nr:acyltransferase [uncultured Kushneria sp.]
MHREKFVALDWLRFALAIYLVLFHTLKEYGDIKAVQWIYSSMSLGFYSTSTFFILSGFLLAHVYIGRDQGRHLDYKRFWIKRFASLYPIHILALIIVLPLVVINAGGIAQITVTPNTNDWAEGGSMASHVLGMGGFMSNLLLHVSLLHAWNPFYTTFNFATWSLSALFFFYLVFPFIGPALARIHRPLLALAAIGLIYALPALYMFLTGTNDNVIAHGLMHRNPLFRLPEFLAGVVLHQIYLRHKLLMATLFSARGTMACLAFILGCFAFSAWIHAEVRGSWYYLLHNGLLLPSQLLLVLMCAWFQPDSNTAQARLAARLGVASLSIFALHTPLNMVSSKIEKLMQGTIEMFTTQAPISVSSLIQLAGEQTRELWMYPFFLAGVVAVCLLFQEQLVNRMRMAIQERLLNRQKRARSDMFHGHA